MRKPNAFIAIAALTLVASASAQEAFGKPGQYAQFRNLSGLPGGTFGVNASGDPDSRGAMAISTPIAYSLRGGRFAAIAANTSYDDAFRVFTRAKKNDFGWKSNGTVAGMAGISTQIGDFTVGTTVVSGAFENSYSFLYTPKQPKGRMTFAVGAEGLFSAGGFLGPGFHDDADRVISAFGVVTWELDNNVFVSGGIGTSRFSQGFVNVSTNLTPRIKVTAEHDGFNFNYGVGAEIAMIKMAGRKVRVTGFAGMIQTRYAFWSMGLSF